MEMFVIVSTAVVLKWGVLGAVRRWVEGLAGRFATAVRWLAAMRRALSRDPRV